MRKEIESECSIARELVPKQRQNLRHPNVQMQRSTFRFQTTI